MQGEGSGLASASVAKSAKSAKRGREARGKTAPIKATAATKQVDWALVASKLPWGLDKESRKRRKALFRSFDPNGNGLMSLAEADNGVVNVLQLGAVICKPVIMRAFTAAKDSNQKKSSKAARYDDYVDLSEFRLFLLYLRQYLELYVMFEAVDTNKDGKIEAGEFAAAVGCCSAHAPATLVT